MKKTFGILIALLALQSAQADEYNFESLGPVVAEAVMPNLDKIDNHFWIGRCYRYDSSTEYNGVLYFSKTPSSSNVHYLLSTWDTDKPANHFDRYSYSELKAEFGKYVLDFFYTLFVRENELYMYDDHMFGFYSRVRATREGKLVEETGRLGNDANGNIIEASVSTRCFYPREVKP